MKHWRAKGTASAALSALLLVAGVPRAFALDVTGYAVGVQPALITSPLDIVPVGRLQAAAVFKIRLRVTTNGHNVRLCMGGPNDFATAQRDARTCPVIVTSATRSGNGDFRDGLGFIDTNEVQGKVLYAVNATSGASPTDIVTFTITVE